MPPLHFADRVRVVCRDTGAGALALDEAMPGHRSFADAAVPPGAAFHYAIAGIDDARQWEVGVGALADSGRLLRQPTASSAGGAPVAFAPGRKSVALTVGAGWYAGQGARSIGDIAGLSDALAGKQPAGDYAPAAHDHPHLPLAGGILSGPLAIAGVGGSGGAPRSALDVRGYLTGGLGALALNSTLDWSAPTVARAGMGEAALRGSAPNGPGGTAFYYSLTFEQGGTFDGSGPITQLAIPRTASGGAKVYYRLGASRTAMEPWRTFLVEDGSGRFASDKDNVNALGSPSTRFTQLYAANGAISTSDSRDKADIGALPDAWLDAWDAVDWRRFRMGGGRRWHAGLVAQAVRDAFAARDLDARALGLLCHDDWSGEDGSGDRTDRWGLRYDECFALEAAATRRRLARLEARLEVPA